jgi:Tfp pilus assembly protein PilX
MKINYSNRAAERGTALLVALFLTTILAVTIAGYLRHSSQQSLLSVRSQTWNLSISVSEAGVEEAMQHLNSNHDNLAVDGWSQSGNTYTVARTLDANTRYTVSINNANPLQPVITSQAFITDPTLIVSTPSPTFAFTGTTIGDPNKESIKSPAITRAVRVTAGRSGLFLKAMVAKHTIDMNGNQFHQPEQQHQRPVSCRGHLQTPRQRRCGQQRQHHQRRERWKL